jgi:hypothetical protein
VSWDGESWKRAAHSYHAARRGTGAVLSVETEPARLRRMRRLMADNISLDTTYRELTDPCDRPTPRFTVEAVMLTVRERGVAALKEPANIERLARCDAAAKVQIDRYIKKLIDRKAIII